MGGRDQAVELAGGIGELGGARRREGLGGEPRRALRPSLAPATCATCASHGPRLCKGCDDLGVRPGGGASRDLLAPHHRCGHRAAEVRDRLVP